MYFKKEIFLIVGLMKSGLSCGKFLLSQGAKCYFYENNLQISEKNFSQVEKVGGLLVTDDNIDDVLNEITTLVLSPGVPIDNIIAKKAKRLGKRITGELELGAEYTNSCIVGITGTNGKTTTTYMIEHILKNAGFDAFAVGNVGEPITSKISNSFDSVAVTEISSFQLESCNRIIPHIALMLNITQDHLERHYTFENYLHIKTKLFQNMRESEYAILNYDDENVRAVAGKTRAKTYYFSTKEKVNGAYLENGIIYINDEEVMKVENINLKGEHNVQNALASILVAKLMGVENDVIASSLKEFKGARHRIEFVKEINGVNFYNDSKSTNPDSTIKAIETMCNDTYLLLGGKDKELDYTNLFEKIKSSKVVKIYLFGEVKDKLYNLAKSSGIKNVSVVENMKSAIRLAYYECVSGCNILLSPACSSFDEFTSYEERGNKFVEEINGLK